MFYLLLGIGCVAAAAFGWWIDGWIERRNER
jgi:hypothetical protein